MSSPTDDRFGSGADKIDDFFRAKRSWSRVKDKILGDYIAAYLKTVHRIGQQVVLVDGFSGPGRFGDDEAGSPVILCESIQRNYKGRDRITCLFADRRASHRDALTRNIGAHIESGLAEPPFDDCAAAVDRALDLDPRATIFFYLDPYGISDLEFDMVKQIYERTLRRSTEVLINFSFPTFMRMSGNWNYGDTANEISRKVKQGKIDTVDKVMGGRYWLEIVTDSKLDKIQREDAIVKAHCKRVREYLPYVHPIPVKERTADQVRLPADEIAHYHLIFGTRSKRAVVYMNDISLNALEPYLRSFTDGLLFDVTPERYQSANAERVKTAIVSAVTANPLTRQEIWERVVPDFFMHHKTKALAVMAKELVSIGRLFPEPSTLGPSGQVNDNTRLSAKAWPPADGKLF